MEDVIGHVEGTRENSRGLEWRWGYVEDKMERQGYPRGSVVCVYTRRTQGGVSEVLWKQVQVQDMGIIFYFGTLERCLFRPKWQQNVGVAQRKNADVRRGRDFGVGVVEVRCGRDLKLHNDSGPT